MVTQETRVPIDGDRLDKLLSKYVSVWLWSLLFSIDSGLGYTFFGIVQFEKWGGLAALLAAILLLGFLANLVSWMMLLAYFTRFLIPQFILGKELPEDDQIRHQAAYWLKRAVIFLLIAAVLRVLAAICALIYQALMRGW